MTLQYFTTVKERIGSFVFVIHINILSSLEEQGQFEIFICSIGYNTNSMCWEVLSNYNTVVGNVYGMLGLVAFVRMFELFPDDFTLLGLPLPFGRSVIAGSLTDYPDPNRSMDRGGTPPIVLTIAGSDSGGGAGIQADVKAIAAAGGFPQTAVVALTAASLLACVLPARRAARSLGV